MEENYFLSRRSCRNFSTDKVDQKKLEEIIFKATKAPTCGNMQLYSIVITEDPLNLKLLARFHYNQPAAITASVIITVCADFNRFTRWCELNKADAGFNNFHSFIIAMTDAVILAQQIVTIAEQEGLGTCYLGTVTYNAKEISDLLDLPALVIPVASIAIGIPEKVGDKTDRLNVKTIIHKEKYRRDSDEEIKNAFKIHDKNPENEKFIKENHKENLAQVFSEVRYPRQLNEEFSKKFFQLLGEKKFK